MKTPKHPLPSCKNCVYLSWVNWEWVCCKGETDTRINRRHARSVARKCPEYSYWRDAFANMRCVVITERKENA